MKVKNSWLSLIVQILMHESSDPLAKNLLLCEKTKILTDFEWPDKEINSFWSFSLQIFINLLEEPLATRFPSLLIAIDVTEPLCLPMIETSFSFNKTLAMFCSK